MSNRVNIKVNAGVEKQVRKQLDSIIQQDDLLNAIGEIARKDIVLSISQGKEPSTGKPFKNPELTSDWVKRKQALSKTNTALTPGSAKSKKARLTFTGEWLKSFVSMIAKVNGRKVIEVFPMGMHNQYIGVKGKKIGDPVSNEEIGRTQLELGRDWTGFSERVRQRIVDLTRAHIRRQLTKRNK